MCRPVSASFEVRAATLKLRRQHRVSGPARTAWRTFMSIDVGSPAPDFTLPNQDREPVTLSALRGRAVVLAFFPAAFSSVCTKELCTFRDRLSSLNGADAQVYGISVDTFFALKAFQN